MATPLASWILFATDFSECALRAWDHVLFLGKACGAGLDILHVLEFQPGMDPDFEVNSRYLERLREQAVPKLDELVNLAALAGLKAQGRVSTGIPSQQINETAKQYDTDLVVLGTHGRTGLQHILMGSTAERVVIGAPCPVLTVRLLRKPQQPGQAQPIPALTEITRILAPVDFSDCSLEALEYAVQVARQFGATVMILHVLEPVAYGLDFTLSHAAEDRKRREGLESRLSQFAEVLRSNDLSARFAVRGGVPAESILNAAREDATGLIVMGTHGRRGVSHLVSGSVAEAVLRHAECPVLTVKSPKFKAGHRRVLPEATVRHVQG